MVIKIVWKVRQCVYVCLIVYHDVTGGITRGNIIIYTIQYFSILYSEEVTVLDGSQ